MLLTPCNFCCAPKYFALGFGYTFWMGEDEGKWKVNITAKRLPVIVRARDF